MCSSDLLSWDYSLENNIEANHKAAADALRAKMGWTGGHYGPTYSGQLEDGRFVHVMTWGEPELLQALGELLYNSGPKGSKEWDRCADQARAAIARAEGRA